MKIELALDLKNPKEKTIVDTNDTEIININPNTESFESVSKDHKPGEYLYNILGVLHYKCNTVSTTPIEVYPEVRIVINDNNIEFYQEDVSKTEYDEIGVPTHRVVRIVDFKDIEKKKEKKSVTIKINLPETCDKCMFKVSGYMGPDQCKILKDEEGYRVNIGNYASEKRLSNCPLKENEIVDISDII